MNINCLFSQIDLILILKTAKNFSYYHKNGSDYFIFAVLDGTATVKSQSDIAVYKKGELGIANRNDEFWFEANGTVLRIYFNSNIFSNIDSNYDFLSPFLSKSKRYYINSEIDSAIKNIYTSLENKKSRFFVYSAVLQLICSINNTYNKSLSFEVLETDSNFAKIAYFIENHLFEELSIDIISQNVFLSRGSICSSIKEVTGQTCREYITTLRLEKAKRFILYSTHSLQQIAKACGFKSYATFFRNYIKQFGITPTEERNKR